MFPDSLLTKFWIDSKVSNGSECANGSSAHRPHDLSRISKGNKARVLVSTDQPGDARPVLALEEYNSLDSFPEIDNPIDQVVVQSFV